MATTQRRRTKRGGKSPFTRHGHYKKNPATPKDSTQQKWDCIYCLKVGSKDGIGINRALSSKINHYNQSKQYDDQGYEIGYDDDNDYDMRGNMMNNNQSADDKNNDIDPNTPFKIQRQSDGSFSSSRSRSGDIKQFLYPILADDKIEKINRFFSYAQITKSISPSFWEDEFVLAALNLLNPSYHPPTRQKFHADMLDARVEEVKEVVDNVCNLLILALN